MNIFEIFLKSLKLYYIKEMKKKVIVCTGGTCRSPMAEAILTKKLKEEKIKGYKIYSCGINSNGMPIEKNAVKALKKMGYKPPKHKSLQLTKELSDDALIITITKFHKEYLSNLKNILTLTDFYSGIDIPDPYGQNLDIYLKTARIIEFIVAEIVQNIMVGKI